MQNPGKDKDIALTQADKFSYLRTTAGDDKCTFKIKSTVVWQKAAFYDMEMIIVNKRMSLR